MTLCTRSRCNLAIRSLPTKSRNWLPGCEQLKQQAQAERAEVEQRYITLLQEHVQCGVTIAKLEAQLAQYLAFMERFRSSLRQEEYGQNE